MREEEVGVGAGVGDREELAVLLRPLTPFVCCCCCCWGMMGPGRFAPHEETTGRGGVGFEGPRDGKSPSERMLGGLEGFRVRFWEGEEGVSG